MAWLRGTGLAWLVVLAGCQSLLGIDDTKLADDAGCSACDAAPDGPTADDAGGPDAMPGLYSLAVDPPLIRILRGDSLTVQVTATRMPGFDEAIDITFKNLPAGTTVALVMIGVGGTSTTALVSVDSTTEFGLHPLLVEGLSQGTSALVELRDVPLLVADTPGRVDTSFNFSLGPGTFLDINDLVIAPSGRIYVGGPMTGGSSQILAFDQDGVRDTTWGPNSDGIVTVLQQELFGLTVRPGGGVVAVGHSLNNEIALAVYLENGDLDTSFATDGTLQFFAGSGNSSSGRAVAITSDGYFLVAGQNVSNNGTIRAIDSSGTVTSFAINIAQATRFEDIALQADGTVVAGGSPRPSGADPQIVILRTTFDPVVGGGFINTSFQSREANSDKTFLTSIFVSDQNHIYYSGSLEPINPVIDGILLGRYESDLPTNPSFELINTITFLNNQPVTAQSIVVQMDNSFIGIALGCSNSGCSRASSIFRYGADRILDASFGPGGQVRYEIPGTDFELTQLVLQDDGRIVAAGLQQGQLWLLRLWD